MKRVTTVICCGGQPRSGHVAPQTVKESWGKVEYSIVHTMTLMAHPYSFWIDRERECKSYAHAEHI